jgi:ABC-type glycerol-3-phosphate transport system substrate-binding protein
MFKSDLDSLPATVMNPADYVKTFYRTASSDLSSGNSIVGIPLGYDALALYINEDIFASAGKTPPTTWDDLRSVAKALTIKNDKGEITQSGVALGRTENVDHWQEILALMMIQNGANLNQPTVKLAEDALNFYSAFSIQDGVWDATLPPSTTAFAAGKLAMYFGPSWRAFEIKEQNKDLKFRTVPLPQLPSENANEPGVSYASYWVEGVWARSTNKTAAWNFLKFLSSKESLEKLYQNAARVRSFGEAYPRMNMASLLSTDPVLGTIVSEAPNAQSWYLYARTWDGPTGINSLINKYFEDAVNSVNQGNDAAKALQTVSSGVTQVLTQYGLLAR